MNLSELRETSEDRLSHALRQHLRSCTVVCSGQQESCWLGLRHPELKQHYAHTSGPGRNTCIVHFLCEIKVQLHFPLFAALVTWASHSTAGIEIFCRWGLQRALSRDKAPHLPPIPKDALLQGRGQSEVLECIRRRKTWKRIT